MNLNCFEIENVTLSLDYFYSLKEISSTFLDYIKQYHFTSVEYHQKLLLLNITHKSKISDISNKITKKQLDFSQILDFINSIPKIFDAYLDNLLFFTEEITKQIDSFDVKNIEQIVTTCETQFNSFKKDLINKTKEVNNTKTNFFSEMEKTEIITYSYYYLNPNYNSNISEKYKNENVTEAEMNMKILDTKEIENVYKKEINEGRNQEMKFIENSKFHSENIKKFTNELMEKIKKFILEFLMSLKNNFKLPVNEIDSFLPQLIKLNDSIKLDETIQKKFKNEKMGKSLFNPEKYNLRIFQKTKKKKENNEIIDEIVDKVEDLEDGLDMVTFITDEISVYTLEKMKKFELINVKDINLEIEKEKIKMNQLTIKLLSNINKESSEKVKLDISTKELDLIEAKLEKHHNRIIFMQKLNKFRVLGNYQLSNTMYTMLSKFFIQILNYILEDNDLATAKNIIVLSQTYFIKEGQRKIYLQEAIQGHELFQEKAFWENLLNFFMQKEKQKYKKNMEKNEIIKEEEDNFSKLAFGQIMTICNNMIDFGFDKHEIYKLVEPKIKHYQLNESFISNIKTVLGFDEENNDK